MNSINRLVLSALLLFPVIALSGCEDKSNGDDGDAGSDASADASGDNGTDGVPDPYPNVDPMILGDSMFVVCLGLDKDYSEVFTDANGVETHDIYIMTDTDQAAGYRYIKESNFDKVPYGVLNYTVADPTTAPPGHNVICIGTIGIFDNQDYWHFDSYKDYEDLRYNMAIQLMERAERDLDIDLASHAEVFEIITPQTMKGFSLNPGGTIFGWAMIPEQSVLKRMPQETPIKNLLLAGAWTFPAGGQSSSIISGMLVGTKIAKSEGFNVALPPKQGPDPRGMNVSWWKNLGIWDKLNSSCTGNIYKAMYTDEGLSFDVPADPEVYRLWAKERYPEDSEAIDKLWQKMYDFNRVMRVLFGYMYSGKLDINSVLSNPMGAVEMVADLTRQGLMPSLMEFYNLMQGKTLSQFMEPYVKSPELFALFTLLAGMAGEGPDAVSAMMHIAMWTSYHLGGFCYTEGGSQAISDAFADQIREHGGTVRLNTLATKIDIDESGLASRVRTSEGTCYKARWVVSNANPIDTMLNLVGAEYMPTKEKAGFYPGRFYQTFPPTEADPIAPPPESPVDRLTGATPEVKSAQLTESHAGWGQGSCLSCHSEDAHGGTIGGEYVNNLGKYTDPQCATCHGANGAPKIPPDAHQTAGVNASCEACHAESHKDLGYNYQDDCRSCHKFDVADGECAVTEEYDVVIIGAGAGGLGAGTYLAQKGLSVIVLERHHKVGGYMTNFVRGDYRFEVSTHGFDGLASEPFPNWKVK